MDTAFDDLFFWSFETDLTFRMSAVVCEYENKKSMEWQVFNREYSQTNHYKGVKNVALSIRLPNSQITFCPVRGFSIISATLVRLF